MVRKKRKRAQEFAPFCSIVDLALLLHYLATQQSKYIYSPSATEKKETLSIKNCM